MSDTPRTDAAAAPAPTPRTDEFLSKIPNSTEWYVFARQLERELAAIDAAMGEKK